MSRSCTVCGACYVYLLHQFFASLGYSSLVQAVRIFLACLARMLDDIRLDFGGYAAKSMNLGEVSTATGVAEEGVALEAQILTLTRRFYSTER